MTRTKLNIRQRKTATISAPDSPFASPSQSPTQLRHAIRSQRRKSGRTGGFGNAKTVSAFCLDIGISVSTFYRNRENMPRSVLVGKQRRILREDEEAWRADLPEQVD